MSLKALETIAQAEERGRQICLAAEAEAKKAIAAAEEAAAARIKAAVEKAEEEIRVLTRKADEKAREEAAALASTTENRKAAMGAHGERVMPQIADKIVERIVSGGWPL